MSSSQPGPLHGAIDTHVHSAPDVVPRLYSDIDVTRCAKDAGMGALVLKNHYTPTTARAQIAESVVGGLRVIGGVVLNTACTGGFGVEAVRANLDMGAQIIWMPTVSARNHIDYVTRAPVSAHISALTRGSDDIGLSPLTPNGRVSDAVSAILDLIAERAATLATGHLSPDETACLIDAARHRGVRRVIVTHPEAPQIRMPLAVQCDLAGEDVFFERCYYSLLAGDTVATVIEAIRIVGVSSTILATDLGQIGNPSPVDGLADYHRLLTAEGMTDTEWRTMVIANPARALGISADLEAQMDGAR